MCLSLDVLVTQYCLFPSLPCHLMCASTFVFENDILKLILFDLLCMIFIWANSTASYVTDPL